MGIEEWKYKLIRQKTYLDSAIKLIAEAASLDESLSSSWGDLLTEMFKRSGRLKEIINQSD